MLPNFLIIGAQKAATTWLAKCLSQHPEIFMVSQKEIHFFNNFFDRGTAWYQAHFKDWAGQPRIGEATPGYLSHPEAPGRIKTVLGPRVKLIASLRHPVDRAYSAFWQLMKQGRIPPETDFRTFMRNYDRFGLRYRGCYYTHLSRYFEYFPRQNLLILIYEEITQDSFQALKDCLEFLEVTEDFRPDFLDTRINRGRTLKQFHGPAVKLRRTIASRVRRLPEGVREPLMNVGRGAFEHLILKRLPEQSNYRPLSPAVRQELLNDFMSEIVQLERLLDRDLSIWYASSE